MKLLNLSVGGLFGRSFDVQFHEDVTLLFGRNGCGKTTILNILSALTRGNLMQLHRYKFDTLVLTARDASGTRRELTVEQMPGMTYLVRFADQAATIPQPPRQQRAVLGRDQGYLDDTLDNPMLDESFDDDDYAIKLGYKPLSELLRSSFRPLYLPLTRKDTTIAPDEYEVRFRERDTVRFRRESNLDNSLRRAVDLVRHFAVMLTRTDNRILERLKEDVLSRALQAKSFDSSELTDTDEYLKSGEKRHVTSYLQGLNLPVEESLDQLTMLIGQLRYSFHVDESGINVSSALDFANYVSSLSQLHRVREVLGAVQKATEERAQMRKPLTSCSALLTTSSMILARRYFSTRRLVDFCSVQRGRMNSIRLWPCPPARSRFSSFLFT